MPKLVRAKELADILSVHISTIWRWHSEGKIPKSIKLGPMVTVWNLDEVNRKFLKR